MIAKSSKVVTGIDRKSDSREFSQARATTLHCCFRRLRSIVISGIRSLARSVRNGAGAERRAQKHKSLSRRPSEQNSRGLECSDHNEGTPPNAAFDH